MRFGNIPWKEKINGPKRFTSSHLQKIQHGGGADFMTETASLRDWQQDMVIEWKKCPTCTSVNQNLHALD